MTLEEVDGKTKLTDQSVFQSVADRDGMVQSGMEAGATERMDRLDELLAASLLGPLARPPDRGEATASARSPLERKPGPQRSAAHRSRPLPVRFAPAIIRG